MKDLEEFVRKVNSNLPVKEVLRYHPLCSMLSVQEMEKLPKILLASNRWGAFTGSDDTDLVIESDDVSANIRSLTDANKSYVAVVFLMFLLCLF